MLVCVGLREGMLVVLTSSMESNDVKEESVRQSAQGDGKLEAGWFVRCCAWPHCPTHPHTAPHPSTILTSPPTQAFNWESHKSNWYKECMGKVADWAKQGFTCIWLPPPSDSVSPQVC